MGDLMQEKSQEKEAGSPTASQRPPLNFKAAVAGSGRRAVSYKDKLLVLNGDGNSSDSEDEDWMTMQRKEEEEEEDDTPLEEGNQGLQDDPLCPTYHYSKANQKEDCKKWRTALIVKLLGQKISSKFLVARLHKMWSLTGMFESIELDNDYVLFKFHDQRDYIHVLQDGPWVIADHYAVV